MARVTVEDCIKVVSSRFELVLLASQRAKAISSGGEICVERDNDKNPVIALREIGGEYLSVEKLRENLIRSSQDNINLDEYGVEEEDEDVQGSGISSGEIAQEVEDLAVDDLESSGAISMTYGEDNLDVED